MKQYNIVPWERLGAEVLALGRNLNTNNDINNETLKTHNCERERERDRERVERVERV